MTWTVGLLGDVMLGRGVAERLASAAPEELWAPELVEITSSLDLLICNLECCISDRGQPTELIRGKRFLFRAPEATVASLAAVGVDAVGLANNHTLDFGPDALSDTIRQLHERGIAAAGAGHDPEQARRGVIVGGPDMRLGLVAVSDHPSEFAATPERCGISYADLRSGAPDWLVEEVRSLRQGCDLVLAFPHWGPNMSIRPARWQRRVAAELIRAGADLVAGHSAHVFHGIGQIDDRLVAYDIGDALDDYAVDAKLRNDLGVLAVWCAGPQGAWLELVGLSLEYCHTTLATGADADWIAARLGTACAELGTGVERLGEQRFRVTAGPGARGRTA
jgi:poly-gamma-glutamate capsule biosynthesis protein CapA/YwtB (metallophosphatase superfamily)